MRIDNWAYLDPDLKRKIRDTIEKEMENGQLTEHVSKYTDGFIRFDPSKDKSGYSGMFCNSKGERIRKFIIDSEFNFKWRVSPLAQ